MSRKIKLIWDFRGPAASKTAAHHEKHLKEYILIEEVKSNGTGFKELSDMHSIAFMVIEEKRHDTPERCAKTASWRSMGCSRSCINNLQ